MAEAETEELTEGAYSIMFGENKLGESYRSRHSPTRAAYHWEGLLFLIRPPFQP